MLDQVEQQLVFIGVGMDKDAIKRKLDSCVLTDEEMAAGPSAWAKWPLPWTPGAQVIKVPADMRLEIVG